MLKGDGLTKNTLIRLALGKIFMVAATTSPYFLHTLVKQYFNDKTLKASRARAKKLRELEKRNLIKFQQTDNGTIHLELTHQGRHIVRLYNLETMKLKKPKEWDGKWRILIYDIPKIQKGASNAFRTKIRQLGLFPLQKSVWVSPYECLPEIEFLAVVFNINFEKCISYFRTAEIPKTAQIKEFFGFGIV